MAAFRAVPVFRMQSRLDHTAEEVFAWHARPGALERLLPPWQRVRVVEASGGIEAGARVVLELGAGPLRARWVAVHTGYEEGRQFVDEMTSGPFARWRHEHRFSPAGDGCALEDQVDYALRGGALGRLTTPLADSSLTRTFRFRHRRLRDDLGRHARVSAAPPLRVALSGASGLIGRQLAAFLTSGGHRVERLVRRAARSQAGEIPWDPERGELDPAALEGVDAFVHLAGESIDGRWTREKRRRIAESRARGTHLVAETLARVRPLPRVLVSASAVGYYGDRAETLLDEGAGAGTGFLAEVCTEWESATEPARTAGIRVVNARIGVALTAAGGALARLLTPFRLAAGGPVGSGRQYLSWISLDDVVGALHHLLFTSSLAGPVNLVAPGPVTSRDFARTLGAVLRRPARLPLPSPVVRLALGRMGEELLLSGQRVSSARLQDSGFPFLHADLDSALRSDLGR